MPYVELDVPPGTAEGIARFYREIMGAPARLEDGAARVDVGPDQVLLYRETERELPAYDGHHIQVYIADFSGPYRQLLERGLVSEESDQHQYRFRDLVDPASGRKLFTLEHEVRSMRHPLYARPLVNRDPEQSNVRLRARLRCRAGGAAARGAPVRELAGLTALVARSGDAIERERRLPPRAARCAARRRLVQAAAAEGLRRRRDRPGGLRRDDRRDRAPRREHRVVPVPELRSARWSPRSSRPRWRRKCSRATRARCWPGGRDRTRARCRSTAAGASAGSFAFASGGRHANWLGGYCKIEGSEHGRTMLFPADKARMSDIWQVIGLRGTASDAYEVKDLFVPAAFSVSRDDQAERRYPGPLYCLPTGAMFAAGFAGVATGLARALIDALTALALEKTPRGYRTRLRENALFQADFAQAEARLRAARMYLTGTLAEVWREVEKSNRLTLEQRMAIRLAASQALRRRSRQATRPTMPRARARCSSATPSSGAFATCTPWRSSCRAAARTSRRWGATCWVGARPELRLSGAQSRPIMRPMAERNIPTRRPSACSSSL